MSTDISYAPKKPNDEMMAWLDEAWTLNKEGVVVWKRDGKSRSIKKGDPVYCCLKSNGYTACRTSTNPRRTISTHHLVWYFSTGTWPEQGIDHIDGNRSNNSIDNLRLASRSQNAANRKNWRNEAKGVYKSKKTGKYLALIRKDKKRIFLGQFFTAQEAGDAYSKAAEELHGEFAYHISQEVI
jgi:hypothetical protein